MEVRKTLGEKEADDEKGRPLDLSPTLPPGVGALPTKTAPIRENSAAEKHPNLFWINITLHPMTIKFLEKRVPYFYDTAVYIKQQGNKRWRFQ